MPSPESPLSAHVDSREVEQARGAALAAVQARSHLIERLGCDVRRPLAVLREALEQLDQAEAAAPRRERLDRVQAACEALIGQVDELLCSASLQTPAQPAGRVVFDPRAAVALVLESLAPLARSRGVPWSGRVAANVPEVLVGDATMLRQLLLLLCARGLRESGEAGIELDVSAGADRDGEVELGFLLAPPGGVEGACSGPVHSDDLELTLCTQLARGLDGRLRLLRPRGGGWGAELSMRADVAPDRRSLARALGRRPSVASLRVLLASDSAASGRLMTRLLAGEGHEVVQVGGGLDVTAALPDERYQLLILDRDLPDLDGFSTLRVVRARELHAGGRIPAILLCSPGQEMEQRTLLDAGADACVAKPVDEEALLWAVARACGPAPDSPSD